MGWVKVWPDDDGGSSRLVGVCKFDGGTGITKLKIHHSSNISCGGGAESLVTLANG